MPFPGLELSTTRNSEELTGNGTAARGIENFAEGLAKVYGLMAKALKPQAPLAFTFHHNQQEAYLATAIAILDAGLTCTASLPCPAEMGGSIHIAGTGSSIVDTVFVCRKSGEEFDQKLFSDTAELARIISDELDELRAAGMKPTAGDVRCISYGHLTRMAIWKLRGTWENSISTKEKFSLLRNTMNKLSTLEQLTDGLAIIVNRSLPDHLTVQSHVTINGVKDAVAL